MDRFGDYGIVGVALLESQKDVWRIDTFLLSCRILGRGVEKAFIGFILDQAKKVQIPAILGEFIPTAKNKPAESFFADTGFILLQTEENAEKVYEYTVTTPFEMPDFITIHS